MAVCNAVADSVFDSISRGGSEVSDDQLSILHFLYGKNLERALRIVDLGGVKRIAGEPSGRALFLVVGESRRKEEYICFPAHHCTCYSFFYDVVNKAEQLCVRLLVPAQSPLVSISWLHGSRRWCRLTRK
ncbi:uncharacterized protein LOC116266965 isoform X4 [Nymphaea colorata]|uniref:uncharacterized protein LOC116266965 isoform X4 n=1 Tax=Nymphaea colorata TaxID=210225 RepID=UPI00129E76A9|nr:uncharacterized protein LOC116266965 isoform X4 [Nymphaea colorata]